MNTKIKRAEMKILLTLIVYLSSINFLFGQMSNSPTFDPEVKEPAFEKGEGPRILLDVAHHNFFMQKGFIEPFANLARSDGYQTVVDSAKFTPDYLEQFDIVMIVTALPFEFGSKKEVTNESTFTDKEIGNLHDWVNNGGSLLVFTEHAPFDQAINPLLNRFGISSSVGLTVDTTLQNPQYKRAGWIEYTIENGGLNGNHPIIMGNRNNEKISKLLTFGGSSLTGDGFANLLRLSESSENIEHSSGVGPSGKGNSQGLAGHYGQGKIAAFGDSNGFIAMDVKLGNGELLSAGMHVKDYDWKQFVLNTLHWLSGALK